MSKVVLYDTADGFPEAPGALEAVNVTEPGVKYDFGFINQTKPTDIDKKNLKEFMAKLSTKAIIYVPQTPKQKQNNKLELETAYAWLDIGLVPLYAQRSDNKENKFLQFSTEESDLYGKLFGSSRDSEALQTAIARYTSYKEKNKPKAGLLFQDLKLQRENAQYREEELRKDRELLVKRKEELEKKDIAYAKLEKDHKELAAQEKEKDDRIIELLAKTSIYDYFQPQDKALNDYGYPGCANLNGAECFKNIEKKHQEIETQKEQLQNNKRAYNNLQERFKTKEDDFLALTQQFNTRGQTKKLLQDELELKDKEVKTQKRQLESNKTELTKLRTDRDKMESALKIAQKKLDKIKPQTLRTFIEANKTLIENDFPRSLASCVLNDEDVVSGDCMNEFQNLLNELLEFKKTGLTKLLNEHERLKKKLENNLNVKLSGEVNKDFETLDQEIKKLRSKPKKKKEKSIYETIREYLTSSTFLSILTLMLVTFSKMHAALSGGGTALPGADTGALSTNVYGQPHQPAYQPADWYTTAQNFNPEVPSVEVYKPRLDYKPSNIQLQRELFQNAQKAVYPVSIYVQQKFGLRMEQAARSIIKQATDYDILRLYESFPENFPTFKFNLKDLKAGRDIFDKIASSSKNESLTWRVNNSGEGGTVKGSKPQTQSAIEPIKTQRFPDNLDDLNKLLESEGKNLNELRFDYGIDRGDQRGDQRFEGYKAPVHVLTALLAQNVKFLQGQRVNMIDNFLKAGASPKFMNPKNVAINIIYQANKLKGNQREAFNEVLKKFIDGGMPVYGQYFDPRAPRYYDTPVYGKIIGWWDYFMMHEHPRLKGTSTGEILKRAYDNISSSGSSPASIAKREHEAEIEEDRQFVIEDIEKNKQYEESLSGNQNENENDEGDAQSIVRSKIENEAKAKSILEHTIEKFDGLYGIFTDAIGTVRESVLEGDLPVPYEKQISGLMMPRTERSRILASRLMY